MQFTILAAVDDAWGLSREGRLPWRYTKEGREDMQRFTHITKNGPGKAALIMGRHTWESIDSRPLKGRVNVVVSSRNAGITIEGALTNSPVVHVGSFESALAWVAGSAGSGLMGIVRCYVIGGAAIYQQAMRSPYLTTVEISRIPGDYECNLVFPRELLPADPLELRLKRITIESYSFHNSAEESYLKLLGQLLRAPTRPNRTAVPTRSRFYAALRFPLADPRGRVLPLLTTKRVHWPAIYHELVWFLRGSTETSYLIKNSVRIWDGNSSADFLRDSGLAYSPGEVGPIYGWQWRHWGESWTAGSQIAGIDQIAEVIRLLQKDVWSRRGVVSAWNPCDLPEMALPPCHYSFQFVAEPHALTGEPTLNCVVNMRSADVPLGVPFNIASYAMLTHIVSHITGISPGELVISMADVHMYETHAAACETLVGRKPRRFPTISFGPRIVQKSNPTIDDFANEFVITDYIVENYAPHPRVRMVMVA